MTGLAYVTLPHEFDAHPQSQGHGPLRSPPIERVLV